MWVFYLLLPMTRSKIKLSMVESKDSFLSALKRGFLFYVLSTLLIAIQFGFYIVGTTVLDFMDFEGWLFFMASCVSHASQFALIPFLAYVILSACKLRRLAVVTHVALVVVLCIVNYLNMQVFALYRFHINGFVLNMFFGDSAGEIFTFDTMLYVKEFAYFLLLAAVVIGLWWLSTMAWRRWHRAFAWLFAGIFVGCTLFAHGWHVYASFMQHQSVVKSARLLPYYFPTTAYGFMVRHGFVAPEDYHDLATGSGSSDVQYPLHDLVTETPDSLPNIVFILIDSWNRRAFTPECMPTAYDFAQRNQWFANHVSGSNGTRSAVFSLFFGVPCYYWEAFESSHIKPPLVSRLLELGYDFRAYPSASLLDPPFAKVLFSDVDNLTVETKGETVLERDNNLADNFLTDLKTQAHSGKPFFSFLFFDLPHSFQLPKDKNNVFQPAWDYADYTKLSNDMDPTPFWNLYRNCCRQDDMILARIFKSLEDLGLMENTVVILTGDHSQEFNENHRNYWGHNGNFSKYQIAVPFVCHFPSDRQPHKYEHRTTHYDLVPTLMKNYLGVKNDIGDYSAGHLLTDTVARRWHVVGSNLNYAFIIDGDSILEKTADGALDVYDANLNPVVGYKLPVKEFNEAMGQLNKYFK